MYMMTEDICQNNDPNDLVRSSPGDKCDLFTQSRVNPTTSYITTEVSKSVI